eukprot:CAMPEP_0178958806 /NCGR_PEP_ID=MMETSP0789-20121207/11866_1 /TAXON_ID=3005 /ORGANISM="Rhizosolenia setigera, Strain CCMP 1694" /LENGTH=164 /DNA_ID=CAMNT_0020641591 /DNA_START=85 /DNA_END=579 /DNA_ORIENTATION=+
MSSTVAVLMRHMSKRSLAQKVFSGKTPLLSSMSPISTRFMSTHYTKAHEYVKMEGNIGTVGITDFAQSALGDIVFIDLPEVGDEFEKGESFGSVESVKAASDVYAPVTGTVVEINSTLGDEPGIVNTHAESDGWFIKLEASDAAETDDLLDTEEYTKLCEEEAS